MAAVLGLGLQTSRFSVRYLLPRVCRLKYCHKSFFRPNYGLGELRVMNSEPELHVNVQTRNGKASYNFTITAEIHARS